MALIRAAIHEFPTQHEIYRQDARDILLPAESVHLIVTSPPYWTLKEYRDTHGQLGHIEDYGNFLDQLDLVWQHCFDALVPGGRLCMCCWGCVPRGGRTTVVTPSFHCMHRFKNVAA